MILVHGGPVKRFVKIHRVHASEILVVSLGQQLFLVSFPKLLMHLIPQVRRAEEKGEKEEDKEKCVGIIWFT